NYEHTTFGGLSHAIELMLTYFPLGFVFGWAFSPKRALGWSLILTFAIATPIEFLQGWIVGRYPDITDIAISVVGAGFGVLAATRGAAGLGRSRARKSGNPAPKSQFCGRLWNRPIQTGRISPIPTAVELHRSDPVIPPRLAAGPRLRYNRVSADKT